MLREHSGESNRLHAVGVLDNFMLEMEQQYLQQQYHQQVQMQAHYQQQQQQQYHPQQQQLHHQHYVQSHNYSQQQHMYQVSASAHSSAAYDEHMMDVDF